MNKQGTFRQQQIIRGFAFAGIAATLTMAGCASDGSAKPSTQQQITQACARVETGLAVAQVFAPQMNATQQKLLIDANEVAATACNPSALASYGTPQAAAVALASLMAIATQIEGLPGQASQVPVTLGAVAPATPQ